jgi:hypothetical protein
MPLSERTRNLLLNAIAVSPIMKRFALPGLIGMLLIGVGIWQKIDWLWIAGLVLAAPVLWCYLVIMLVYPIMALFTKSQPRHWKE